MKLFILLALVCILGPRVTAQTFVLEPDNYTNGAVLNHVLPQVSLTTAGANNLPIPPVSFDITAVTSTFPYVPPTGSNIFAHAGVGFFNSDRRLRADFATGMSSLSIIFQGSSGLVAQQGTLQAFNINGVLLESFTTTPLFGGQSQTMFVNRAGPDIAWAVAYTITPNSPFGRLDQLSFTAVPEPGALALCAVGTVMLLVFRARRK